jgi:hypothetical protein
VTKATSPATGKHVPAALAYLNRQVPARIVADPDMDAFLAIPHRGMRQTFTMTFDQLRKQQGRPTHGDCRA